MKEKKKKLKWYIKLLIYIVIIIIYAFTIGTKGIFIKDHIITSNKISNEFHGFKILQFSDIHLGSSFKIKDIKNLKKKINDSKPDIVIFTGDFIDKNSELTNNDKKEIIKELKEINSKYGKYYILSSEDKESSTEILEESEFINLDDEVQYIYINNSNPIVLLSKNNITNYEYNENIFSILSIHNPNEIDDFLEYNIDVALAGHTHNGQINIPKLKELYINSNYYKEYQKVNNTKLYINSGLGTKGINARLFNHPCINLYRLNKKN